MRGGSERFPAASVVHLHLPIEAGRSSSGCDAADRHQQAAVDSVEQESNAVLSQMMSKARSKWIRCPARSSLCRGISNPRGTLPFEEWSRIARNFRT